jgi:hypothetical protein
VGGKLSFQSLRPSASLRAADKKSILKMPMHVEIHCDQDGVSVIAIGDRFVPVNIETFGDISDSDYSDSTNHQIDTRQVHL